MELLHNALHVLVKLEKVLSAFKNLNDTQKIEVVQTLCRFGVLHYNPKRIYLTASQLPELEAEIIEMCGGEIDTQDLLEMFLTARIDSRSYYLPEFATIQVGKIHTFDVNAQCISIHYFDVLVLKLIQDVKLPEWIDDIPVVDDELTFFKWVLDVNSIVERNGLKILVTRSHCFENKTPASFDLYFNDANNNYCHFFCKNVQRGLEITSYGFEHQKVMTIGRAKDFNKRVTDAIDAVLEHLRKVEQAA